MSTNRQLYEACVIAYVLPVLKNHPKVTTLNSEGFSSMLRTLCDPDSVVSKRMSEARRVNINARIYMAELARKIESERLLIGL